MFLGRHTDLSWLLDMAMPVHDDLLFSMELPTVSLLSIGLLADEYGETVVTLKNKSAHMNISPSTQMQAIAHE
jgi:hypothetical protein